MHADFGRGISAENRSILNQNDRSAVARRRNGARDAGRASARNDDIAGEELESNERRKVFAHVET